MDRIRNERIRGTAQVRHVGDKLREARLRWFGHMQRRDSEYIGRKMLKMELTEEIHGCGERRYASGIKKQRDGG